MRPPTLCANHIKKYEGEFHQLSNLAERFADRRNDVAHGIVHPIGKLSYFRQFLDKNELGSRALALIPPLYTIRRHDKDGRPMYAYSSVELFRLTSTIAEVWFNLSDFRNKLVTA